MRQVSTICDMCGRVRGEANHWFRAGVQDERILVMRWDDHHSMAASDLCGEDCLHKFLCTLLELIKENNAKPATANV